MCFIRPLSFAFFQNRRPWCQSTTPQRAPSLPPSRRARLSTALRRGTRQRTGKSCSPWPGPVLSPPQAPGPVAAHTHTCGCLGSCRVVPVPGGEYRIACPFRPRACAFRFGAPTAPQCPNGVQFWGRTPPAVSKGVHRGQDRRCRSLPRSLASVSPSRDTGDKVAYPCGTSQGCADSALRRRGAGWRGSGSHSARILSQES
jgi:hypothetical protein